MKSSAVVLAVSIATGLPAIATAQSASDLNSQVSTMNNVTASQGETNVINKISSDFNSFLGTDSKAVVTGLRNGTPITLTSTSTAPSSTPGALPATTATTINPPTGHMGFGNVYISLALAKQELSTMGITQPTPEQLQAALNGGTITQTTGTGATATTTTQQLPGILTMRSQHMGWGQIAQKLGFKLGPVIASMKSGNQSVANVAATSSKGNSVSSVNTNTSRSDSGIVSASGKAQGNANHGISGGKSSSDGIVSASGKGNGNAYGRGDIVSASGSTAGSNSGVVSARGASANGSLNGKGHSK